MEPDEVRIRPATPADTDTVLALLHNSFEGYSEFAPAGWQPPLPTDDDRHMTAEKLADSRVWYRVAEDASGHAGQCGFNPAYEERWMQGEPIPGLAHFWQLFVRPDLWGSGLAAELHGQAVAEMLVRGFSRARLMTPAGQSRARRFYEKRGWEIAAELPAEETPPLSLDLIEYRLEL